MGWWAGSYPPRYPCACKAQGYLAYRGTSGAKSALPIALKAACVWFIVAISRLAEAHSPLMARKNGRRKSSIWSGVEGFGLSV